MAIFYNSGTSGSDLSAALSSWPIGASGDSVILSRGADEYTVNVNNPGKDLLLLALTGAFAGSLGSGSAYSAFDANVGGTGKVRVDGPARALYLKGGTGGTIAMGEFEPQLAEFLAALDSMTMTEMRVRAGRILAAQLAVVTTLRQWGGSVNLALGGTASTLLQINGGVCEVLRDFTDAVVERDGTLLVSDKSVTPGSIALRGNMTYRGGDCATLECFPGSNLLVLPERPIAIATWRIHPGATIQVAPGMVTSTPTVYPGATAPNLN